MAFNFKNGFNKFADISNKINEEANKMVGKEVFKSINKIEEPKEFPALSTYPQYSVPEPNKWEAESGEEQKFIIDSKEMVFTKELDSCFKYKKLFEENAKYYLERFKFRYQQCVNDYDSFVNYFQDIYLEGLIPMSLSACSVLLPFGIFNYNAGDFVELHNQNYRRAIRSYEIMVGVEEKIKQTAQQAGNLVGNSVQMQGGGFGMKGAAKGVAKAEAFNLGMGLLGKFVEHQNQMTPEQKAEVFAKFNTELFYEEVYSDYFNTFLTMVKILADNGILAGVKVLATEEYKTTISNLQNPMFPQDKFADAIINLIKSYPFEEIGYNLLKEKYPVDKEVERLLDYLNIGKI